MKCQVAATAVALATLARERFVPNGDLMLILTADEEVGEAGVGASGRCSSSSPTAATTPTSSIAHAQVGG